MSYFNIKLFRQTIGLFLLPLLFTGFVSSQNIFKDYWDGQIYFKLKSHISWEIPTYNGGEISKDYPIPASLMKKYDVRKLYRPFTQVDLEVATHTYKIKFDNAQQVDQFVEDLERQSFIEYAERVPIYRTTYSPNDPNMSSQWYPSQINAGNAWDLSKGDSNVTVAISDNAIAINHNDLQGNLWVNADETPGNNTDDDGNGYIDDVNGYDVADNDNDPTPPTSSMDHGTHVAGIASATTDNNTGIASIGFNTSIIAIKIGRDSDGALVGAIGGIQYAISVGADVLNMSWGGSGSATLQNWINAAYNNGIVLVAAAGNDNSTSPHYPAAYNNVIAVASSNSSDQKSWFSNYGSWIDVTAPGSSIYSTLPWNTYGNKSGTSMASPVVAGIAGLMRSVNPTLSPDSIKSCLISSADAMPSDSYYNNGDMGGGRVDAYDALQCIGASNNAPPTAQFTANETNIYAGGSINFTDLSSNFPTSWQWSFPGGTPNSSTQQHPSNITYNTPGTYDVTLIASNSNGSDTLTKTNYIKVDSALTCDTVVTYLERTSSYQYYFPNYEVGNNYDFGGSAFVTGYYVALQVTDIINTKDNFQIKLYDAGPDSLPTGAPLATQAFQADSVGAYWKLIRFSNPAQVTSRFVTVVDGVTPVDDTLGVITNNADSADGNGERRAEIKVGGTWYKLDDFGSYNLDFMILPVLIDTLPAPAFTQSSDSICEGMSVSYDATPSTNAYNYYWICPGGSPNTATGVNPNIQYNSAGTYDVTLIVENCATRDTLTKTSTIDVLSPPSVTVSPVNTTICEGDTTTLTASGASSYTWTPGVSLSATTGSTVQAFPSDTTTYQIQGFDPSNQCSGSAAATVNVKKINMGVTPKKPAICSGDSVTITVSGASSYSWTPSNGLSSTTGATVTAFPSNTTTYTVTGTDGACSDTMHVTVNVSGALPTADFTANSTSTCAGSTIQFDASSSTNAVQYDWMFPGGSPDTSNQLQPVISYDSAGTYTVTLSVSNGCGTDSTGKVNYVTVNSLPNVTVAPQQTIICQNGSDTLTASGAQNYTWQPASGLSDTTGTSVIASPNDSTKYIVLGTDANGCTDSAHTTVNVDTCTGITKSYGTSSSINAYISQQRLIIQLTAEQAQEADIRLFNTIGQLAILKSVNFSKGYQKHMIDVSGLSKGVYLLRIVSDQNSYTAKVSLY